MPGRAPGPSFLFDVTEQMCRDPRGRVFIPPHNVPIIGRMPSLRAATAVAVVAALLVALVPSARASPLGALSISGITAVPVDTDRSGLWDTLLVNVSVSVGYPGPFEFTVTFSVPQPASPYTYVSTENGTDTNLTAGSHVVTVRIPTDIVGAEGTSGPYRVDTLVMTPDTGGWMDGVGQNTTWTPAWTPAQFDGPAVRVVGPITDQGIDLYGGGLFDELVIHIPVQVAHRVTVNVVGEIDRPPYLPYWSDTLPARSLDSGRQVLDAVFDAHVFWPARWSGPYNVTLSFQGTFVRTAFYTTTAYNYTQFAGRPADFAGAPTTTTIDTDGNGKADFLRFHVPLRVRIPGNYSVSADCADCGTSDYLGPVRYLHLDAGLQTVDLDFSGIALGQLPPYTPGDFNLRFFDLDPHLLEGNSTSLTVPGFATSSFEYRSPVRVDVNVTNLSPSAPCAYGYALDPVTHYLVIGSALPGSPNPVFFLYNGTFDIVIQGCGAGGSVGFQVVVNGATTVQASLPPTPHSRIDGRVALPGWDAGSLTMSLSLSGRSAIERETADFLGNRDGTADGGEIQMLPFERIEFDAGFPFIAPPDAVHVAVDGATFTPAYVEALAPDGAGPITSSTDLVVRYQEPLRASAPIPTASRHNLTVDFPYSSPYVDRSLEIDLPAGAAGNLSASSHIWGLWGGFNLAGNATAMQLSVGSWRVQAGWPPAGQPSATLVRASVVATQGPVGGLDAVLIIVGVVAIVAVVIAVAVLWWAPRRKKAPPTPPA